MWTPYFFFTYTLTDCTIYMYVSEINSYNSFNHCLCGHDNNKPEKLSEAYIMVGYFIIIKK